MVDVLITIIAVCLLVMLWVMIYDSNRFVTVRYAFSDERIRQDCRAVVLADLHNKLYGRDNERLIEAIREEKPDMILLAGDILTAKSGRSLETALHLLEELKKDFPVYYGIGNHEQRMKLYPQVYGDMAERFDAALAKLDIRMLANERISLEQYGITIYGAQIDRSYYKRFKVQDMQQDYLQELFGAPDPDTFAVLLAHNPDYFPQYSAWGADLVLSGHIHGGVIRIPFWGKGLLSPAIRFFPRYDGGRYEEGKSTMLLSRGLGTHTIPFRLFNPGELLVVDFRTNVSSS